MNPSNLIFLVSWSNICCLYVGEFAHLFFAVLLAVVLAIVLTAGQICRHQKCEKLYEGVLPLAVVSAVAKLRLVPGAAREVLAGNVPGFTLPQDLGELDPQLTLLDLSLCSLTGETPLNSTQF